MRRFLAFASLLALVLALLSPLAAADNRNLIVYYAAGSSSAYRYHRTPDCSSLSRSTVGEMTLEEAVARGYTPCSRCHPPVADFEITATPRPKTEGGGSSGTSRSSSGTSSRSGVEDRGGTYERSSLPTPSSEIPLQNKRPVDLITVFSYVLLAAISILFVSAWICVRAEKKKQKKCDSSEPFFSEPDAPIFISPALDASLARPPLLTTECDAEAPTIDLEDPPVEDTLEDHFDQSDIIPNDPIPKNCYIGEDGLPASSLGSEKWGDGYTFYMAPSGRAYHRRGCSVGERAQLHPVNAYTAKTGFRYFNGPHYYRPCSYCKPVLPDLSWYEELKQL